MSEKSSPAHHPNRPRQIPDRCPVHNMTQSHPQAPYRSVPDTGAAYPGLNPASALCTPGAGGYGFSLVFSLIIRSACGCSPGTYGTTFSHMTPSSPSFFLLLFQSVHCRQLRKCRQGMFHGLMGHTICETHKSRTAKCASLYHQKIKFLSLVYKFFFVFHR